MSIQNSRRKFLKLAAAGTCGTIAHRVLSPYDSFNAYAAPGDKRRVLVVVNLAGGCSYNIAPMYRGAYYDKNKTISFKNETPGIVNGVPKGSFAMNNEQGLNPAMPGLAEAYAAGELAVVNMVGYPSPNTSHDQSANIWFRGTRFGSNSGGAFGVAGWGARMTGQLASSFGGFSLGGSNVLVNGGNNPPRSITLDEILNTKESGLPSDLQWKSMHIARTGIIDALGAQYKDPKYKRNYAKNEIDRAVNTLDSLKLAYKSLPKVSAAPPTGKTFTNSGFGKRAKQAADLISLSDLGVQFIFLEMGGFDTHSDEVPRHQQLLGDLSQNLAALRHRLSDPNINRWNDVTVITMSEFCRTFENGSQGTDHGHAGPLFVMGGMVNGGVKNPPPSEAVIASSRGYFHNYDVDFREPFYAAVKHLGLEADSVFPESFSTKNLDLFKA